MGCSVSPTADINLNGQIGLTVKLVDLEVRLHGRLQTPYYSGPEIFDKPGNSTTVINISYLLKAEPLPYFTTAAGKGRLITTS